MFVSTWLAGPTPSWKPEIWMPFSAVAVVPVTSTPFRAALPVNSKNRMSPLPPLPALL